MWRERYARGEWEVRYTDLSLSAPSPQSALLARLAPPARPDTRALLLATLTRKLLTKGTPLSSTFSLPPLTPEFSSELDPSFGLNPAEERLFSALLASRPDLAHVLHVQPPLEAFSPGATERWLDFLLAPLFSSPLALELDGSQHLHSRTADAERDSLLPFHTLRTTSTALPPSLAAHLPPPLSLSWDSSLLLSHALLLLAEALDASLLSLEAPTWSLSSPLPHPVLAEAMDVLSALALLYALPFPSSLLVDEALTWGQSADPLPPTLSLHFDTLPLFSPFPAFSLPAVLSRPALLPVRAGHLPPTSFSFPPPGPDAARALDLLLPRLTPYSSFRPGQREALLSALAGRDTVLLAPTGAGKSLTFHLLSLLLPNTLLLVAPTVALMEDLERSFSRVGITRTLVLTSSKGRMRSLYQRMDSHPFCLVVSPERLQIAEFRSHLASLPVSLLAVDEAHCTSEWGHDFRPSYLRISLPRRVVSAPLLATTATASPQVLRDVIRLLGLHLPEVISAPFSRENLTYHTVLAPLPRSLAEGYSILKTHLDPAKESGILFTPHVDGEKGVLGLSRLADHALGAALSTVYSGTPPKSRVRSTWDAERLSASESFLQGHSPLLVTTKAFALGVDKPDVRYTLHATLPSSLEALAQETGRAGRDSAPAHCVLLASLPPASTASAMLSSLDAARTFSPLGEDLALQLRFLLSAFPSISEEVTHTRSLLALLSGPVSVIPRGGIERERALYRLMLLSLVEDYTVEYGADTLTVYRSSSPDVPAALAREVHALLPHALLPTLTTTFPADAALEALPHLLSALHASVGAYRLASLAEVYRLVASSPTSAEVHAALDHHFTLGPVYSLLLSALAASSPLTEVLPRLSFLPLGPEWASALERLTPLFPPSPLLSLVSLVTTNSLSSPHLLTDLSTAEQDAAFSFVLSRAPGLTSSLPPLLLSRDTAHRLQSSSTSPTLLSTALASSLASTSDSLSTVLSHVIPPLPLPRTPDLEQT